ncbi:hypothetical protein [Geobacillus sp. WSUCF1]|nr:hypothetical protein [Geobacillus sp. WSUCF1]EPR28140.1 Branched-chain amino acid transport system permease protein livM [Geobacillus sp. WSUCF1]
MKKLLLGVVLLIALVFAMPLVLSDFGINLATEIYIMAIFAMSSG